MNFLFMFFFFYIFFSFSFFFFFFFFFSGKITGNEVKTIFETYGNRTISDKEAKEILCNVSKTDKECSLDLDRFVQVNYGRNFNHLNCDNMGYPVPSFLFGIHNSRSERGTGNKEYSRR